VQVTESEFESRITAIEPQSPPIRIASRRRTVESWATTTLRC
jgi:hypothetical protein